MIIVVNSNTTLDPGFTNYVVDAGSSSITITLPLITGDGTSYTITRSDSNSANTLTLNPSGGQTIESQLSYNIRIYNSVTIIALNTNWNVVIGQNGLTGTRGLTGFTGLQGLTGRVGNTGPTGLTGITGLRGATGPIGQTGIAGLRGFTGLQINGFTGLQGMTGFTGLTGFNGFTGLQGFTGLRGATGIRGNTGISNQGLTGATGTNGLAGPTGETGTTAGTFMPNQVSLAISRGNSTDVDNYCWNASIAGTFSSLNVNTTSFANSLRRIRVTTLAGRAYISGPNDGSNPVQGYLIGGPTGGGFIYSATFTGVQTLGRYTIGFRNVTTLPPGNTGNFLLPYLEVGGVNSLNEWSLITGATGNNPIGTGIVPDPTSVLRSTFIGDPVTGLLTVNLERLNPGDEQYSTITIDPSTLPADIFSPWTRDLAVFPLIWAFAKTATQVNFDFVYQFTTTPY